MSTFQGLRAFNWAPIPEPPFKCGFQPRDHSYAEYLSHIRKCTHRDCDRRFVNHMALQVYFARKYGPEGDGTIPANVDGYTSNVARGPDQERDALVDRAVEAKIKAARRARRSGVRVEDAWKRPRS